MKYVIKIIYSVFKLVIFIIYTRSSLHLLHLFSTFVLWGKVM